MDASQDIQRLAEQFIRAFPSLEGDARAVAMQTYRLLALGEPVEPAQVAATAGVTAARAEELLTGWPGVFFDDGRIYGFWGLTCRPVSAHVFEVDGRRLYTWCAWDTLFIPQILGQTAMVETLCPVTEAPVRLIVSPERVERLEPQSAV